jgi:hypothetical protein
MYTLLCIELGSLYGRGMNKIPYSDHYAFREYILLLNMFIFEFEHVKLNVRNKLNE